MTEFTKHKEHTESVANQLEQLFKFSKDNLTYEHWKEVLCKITEFYNSNSHKIDNTENFISELVFILEKIVEIYIMNGKSYKDIRDDLINYFEQIDHTFDQIESDSRIQEDKRIPSFSESLEATLDRLMVTQEVQEMFSPFVESIIVGGSLTYGPFFNVRKEQEGSSSSDIDTIMVIDENFADINENALESSKLFNPHEIKLFLERLRKFRNIKDKDVDVLSQKFEVNRNGDRFDVSIHFMTKKTFDELILSDEEVNDIQSKTDTVVTVLDYREKAFPHKVLKQKNTRGEVVEYEVETISHLDNGEVIVKLPIYIMKDGHYCPGIYQNVILPRCSVFYDKDNTTSQKCTDFFKKIKQLSPSGSVLSSHVRSNLFPPTLENELLQVE